MTPEWLPVALAIGAWCIGSLVLGLFLSAVLHRRSQEAMPARPDAEVERTRVLIELAEQIDAAREEEDEKRRADDHRDAS